MNSLSHYFDGVVAKRLSAVEADPDVSHQHEFNAPAELVTLLGKREYGSKLHLRTTFLYLDDEEDDCERCMDELTFYESRKEPRSEHRVYYRKSTVTEKFQAGDLIMFGNKSDGTLIVIAARAGSSVEKQLLWLFSLSPESLEKTEYRDLQKKGGDLSFAEKRILEELGIEAVLPDESGLGEILEKFGEAFPVTKIFSNYAREKVGNLKTADPDTLLIAWISKEEELFRALERHIVAKRIREGFGTHSDDVDAFVDFSLSVHNRRKARMGRSLENHLDFLFTEMKICFSHGKATEGKKRPDFVFPGIDEYHNSAFPVKKLTVLGAKSTCKDRWRQVLSEAKRVPMKHLITLEPGITEDQTDEMFSDGLQLVVPQGLHHSYSTKQQQWLWNIAKLTDVVLKNQSGAAT